MIERLIEWCARNGVLTIQPLQFGLECASVERRCTRQIFRARDLERRLTVRAVIDREQSRTTEIGIEQSSDDAGCPRAAPAQCIGQLAQARLELFGLALQRKPVVPWLELREERLDHFGNRDLGAGVSALLDLRCASNHGKRQQSARE